MTTGTSVKQQEPGIIKELKKQIMKKLMVLSAAILASGLMAKQADAQIRLGINLHFGARPEYVAPAPVVDDQFYYLPDVEAYYSVNENCYYYNDGDNWVSAAYLPGAYRDYDWRNARRFAVNEPRPYLHNNDYRARYGGVEHRDWNYREGYNNRVYANQDRVDHNHQYHGDDRRVQEPQRNEQFNNRGPQQFENRGDYNRGAQSQPQQNDNRGQQKQAPPQQNYNRGSQQQQAQPQQNNNRGNSYRSAQHFS